MKRLLCVLLILALVSTILLNFNTVVGNEELENVVYIRQYGNCFRYNIQGWIYLYIEGKPYERGFQHGYLLSEEIVDMIYRWSNMIHLHPKISKLNKIISEEKYDKITEVWWNFCTKYSYKFYKDKYEQYPEYMEEIQGITDGVNERGGKIFGRDVTYQDILTCNEMYEFLSKITEGKFRKGVHPLLTLFKNLHEVEPSLSKIGAIDFVSDFYYPSGNHKCNGFTATGDATTDGQLVFSNSMWSSDKAFMWWWSYYITFRWSLILDINPSEGNRIIMASAPGYIWSNHDYYQNDVGIVLLETTCPQGLWDNKGLPLAIRARRAMQYGNSIDDVMKILRYRNDGCMNAVWLIGDAKTGEIARFELGYRNFWYNKTFNGFHWSANNPFSLRVRLEKFSLEDYLKQVFAMIFLKSKSYMFYTLRYFPAVRDLKFEELGNFYYGSIDIDIVKEIMSTDPIVAWSPDCKLTDSKLLENNGLWVFIGNPAGRLRNIHDISDKIIKIIEVPPSGWVRFFGLPENKSFNLSNKELKLGQKGKLSWIYNSTDNQNTFSSSSVIVDDVLYSSTSTGQLIALSSSNGTFLWNLTIGKNPTTPIYYSNKLFIGTKEGLKIIDLNTKNISEKKFGKIISKPVVSDGKIIIGNNKGDVYAINISSEDIIWNKTLNDEIYISEPENNVLFISSGKNCYAIDINSGNQLWFYEINGVITSRPYVYDGVVYFGSWDNFVYALNSSNGELIWKYETGWGVETTPVVSDDLVFFGSHDNNFYALDKNNGEIKWFFTCYAAIHSNPVVYGEHVFFGCDDGRFYALNKTSGICTWFFAPGFTIDDPMYNYLTTPILSNSMVSDDGFVYFGALGNIYSLDSKAS
ncbi:MAG: PQQ-binding-like beta-propeller repeat protein [Candidatus Thermoplasmatota archaeon]|jgi:outer membrane protein assembly factor BamB|nr:PQQ-binding-like beta-propeller repeat protein [Candidatus Thermoplasmatota archaeon]